mgnify:CR=1 FL=1
MRPGLWDSIEGYGGLKKVTSQSFIWRLTDSSNEMNVSVR